MGLPLWGSFHGKHRIDWRCGRQKEGSLEAVIPRTAERTNVVLSYVHNTMVRLPHSLYPATHPYAASAPR
ncbi:MAG: hypothetical protein AAGF95_04365 [Chloroflexota bacterium]